MKKRRVKIVLTKEGKKVAACAAAVVVLLALLLFFALFKVDSVSVVGSTRYSDEELRQMAMGSPLDSNTLLAIWFHRHQEAEDIPFVESFDLEMLDSHSIRIHVNEKEIVGYVARDGQKMYFDKDGNVVESEAQEESEILDPEAARQELETLRQGASACERAWVDEEIERIGSLEGAGMVREVERDDRVAGGANAGRPVVLLTDVTTSAAGERIVQVARAAAEQGLVEVHVVGRATSGAIDYANPLAVSFDEFYTFVYPMSKSEAAARGEGVSGRGVEPDVAVPFTPDECREDRVRKRALDLVCG